ncbi:hypothetical protein ACIBQ1_44010 [Nonomuraea sp. NPDC050153]|uniref:hypothetical protein n=1 Tax=Nonomuraea sp. NPDC050153 TaxID=3364359 RepID=UPI003798CF73
MTSPAGHEEAIIAVSLPTVLGPSHITEPREIAAVVLFPASGKAPDINGSELVIDGSVREEL